MIPRLKKRLRNYRHFETLPVDPRASDLYLVEFPKSGATWLATMLANAALVQSGMPQQANYFNINQYVPDIHFAEGMLGERCYQWPPFRMIKSHAEYNPYYLHIIYLVRSPVAVLRSYYTFLEEHGEQPGSMDAFLANEQLGIAAWRRHVNGWLTAGNQAGRLHLIRYEDMERDPEGELRNLSDNLGLGFTQEVITRAVALGDAEVMKASESNYSARNPRYRLSFVKGGRTDIPAHLKAKIIDLCKDEFEMLGYDASRVQSEN